MVERSTPDAVIGPGLLRVVGLSPAAERVLAMLVTRSADDSGVREIGESTGLPRSEVEAALESLTALGLVSHIPTGEDRYAATPPDTAIDALVIRQREQLEVARAVAKKLAEVYRRFQAATSANPVEILRGREAIVARWNQMIAATTTSFLNIVKPPLLSARESSPSASLVAESDMLNRGVTCRVLYTAELLRDPNEIEEAWAAVERGESARIISQSPLKLAISDKRMALIPLTVTEVESSAAVVHESALLDALAFVFERLWETGTPLTPGRATGDEGLRPAEEVSVADSRLLELLASGMKDEAVAIQLGISVRTVRTRIEELRRRLHAESRFQLAYRALARGWLTLPT